MQAFSPTAGSVGQGLSDAPYNVALGQPDIHNQSAADILLQQLDSQHQASLHRQRSESLGGDSACEY